jgi:hypothetical protein
MADNSEEWRPGSFTKNFSWGDKDAGLKQLHETIRVGFANEMADVPRRVFRARVQKLKRPDYIPLNFFLFNRIVDRVDTLIADELVFQALTEDHSSRFDKLALFAFNFSYVGTWKGADAYQRRPALWSYHYIRDRVGNELNWSTGAVNADDIERFLASHREYTGRTTRKIATNLSYLYSIGRLSEFSRSIVERWWVDALFLALDRIIEDRKIDGIRPPEGQYGSLLERSGFASISGRSSGEKMLATKHLLTLYTYCGGRERFVDDLVEARTLKLEDVKWLLANDTRPQGAVHPTNPRILKSIPRACALLATYSGFDVIDADELANFDPAAFVRKYTRQALEKLSNKGVKPRISAEELMKITRGE